MNGRSLSRASIVLSFFFGTALVAQTPSQPPQRLTPPSLTPTHDDYVNALAALQGKTSSSQSQRTRSPAPAISGTITTRTAPIIVERSLPLTAQESEALKIAHRAQAESIPGVGEHGRVIYTFGEGIPSVITAPEQLSEIELEPGEQIQLDSKGVPMLDLGDWDHWTITPRLIGSGDHAQAFLIVKPEFSGQETTLTIPTDRRIYYIHLLSEPHDYLSQVAFRYPGEDQRRKLQNFAIAQQAQHELPKETAESQRLQALDTIRGAKSTAYDVILNRAARKHAVYLRPAKVYDDGAHTFIQLSEAARYHDLPVLRLAGYSGADAPNWHFSNRDLTYTIDCLTDRMELLSGVGRISFG